MSNIFSLENIDDFHENLDIDELYERKRQQDLNTLALFNKILNRIHVRIKTTSRQKRNEQFCWFVVPEIIIGVPKYDQGACIAYLMDKLTTNGFQIRYIDPNMLFISWMHWVPSYVRTELKKKTGIEVDEYGRRIESKEEEDSESNENPEQGNIKENNKTNKKYYPSVQNYRPSGNLVYADELLTKIEDKFQN
jgi:hypothetical protein